MLLNMSVWLESLKNKVANFYLFNKRFSFLFFNKMLDPSLVRILNEGEAKNEIKEEPNNLAKYLHHKILKLKGKYLLEDGSRINYENIRNDPEFAEFQEKCKNLSQIDLKSIKENERKAFFINIYNTLTLHSLVLFVKDEKSVLELEKFWQMNAYKIGEFTFSLDDIEHGSLRCNKLHPTYKDYFFKEGDPRREFVESEIDPRIHFALNCGAKSCPPIRLFTPENLEKGLNLAATNFCQSDIVIDREAKIIKLSKIFMWYGCDFGPDKISIMLRIKKFLSEEQAKDLDEILLDEDDFEFDFSDYDWKID